MGLKEVVLLYDDYSFAQLIGNCNIQCSHHDCRFSPATADHEHSTTGISIFTASARRAVVVSKSRSLSVYLCICVCVLSHQSLSKRPSSFCLIHLGGSSGAAR